MQISKIKRFMATLLAMAMVMGITPMSALAGHVNNIQQIMKGNFIADDDTQTVTTNVGNATKTIDDGKINLSKTISATGIENEFDITLQVETTQDFYEDVFSPDAAVVVVMDTSVSMQWDIDGGGYATVVNYNGSKCDEKYHNNRYIPDADDTHNSGNDVYAGGNTTNWLANSRIEKATKAVSSFIDGYTANTNGAKRMISVVNFSERATQTMDWKNLDDANDISNAKSEVNALCNSGNQNSVLQSGTNIHDALEEAKALLESDSIKDIKNKYVILLTDGEPNRYNDDKGEPAKKDKDKFYSGPQEVAEDIAEDATIYAIAYGSDVKSVSWIGNKVDSDYRQNFIAYDNKQTVNLNEIFQTIVNQITVMAQAWTVNDPMGEYIDFVDIQSGQKDNPTIASCTGDVLTWNLKADTAETENNKNVYTLKYRVKLDTAKEGFKETENETDKYYPTNGYTTLKYVYYNDKGEFGCYENGKFKVFENQNEVSPFIASFNVPGVKGTIPEVNYKINYWYKDRDKNYYVIGKEKSDSAKMWSTITINSTDYNKVNYKFTRGDNGTQTLSADNMEFNLYYDPIPVNVTVKHWVSTVNKTDDGETYSKPTLQDVDTYEDQYFKGDKFTNTEFLSDQTYTQVNSITVDDKTYTTDDYTDVTLDDSKTINIYYTKTGDDNRTKVDYEIHYFYRDDKWELNETTGKYEKVTGEYVENTNLLEAKEEFHGTTVTAPDKSNGYTLDTVKTPSMQLKLDKTSETNRLDVYYYKEAPATPDAQTATLTIEHKYYQETINGEQEVTADNWTEYDKQTVYVGETWQATPNTKDDYQLKTIASDFTVTITEAGENYHIVVEYYKDVRVPVEVVVNHYYTTYKWEIVDYTETVTDDEGNTTGGEAIYDYVAYPVSDTPYVVEDEGYVGKYYTPAQVPNGFTFDAENSDSARALQDGTNTFNLYYVVYEGSEDDNADVTINHIYETYTSYIDENGNVVLNALTDTETVSEDTRYGFKGDVIDAVKAEKDGFTFVKADTENLKVTLKGIDGQYNIYYRQDINNLGDKYTVNVQPIYKTYSTYINENGETVTELIENGVEYGQPVPVETTYYAGQTATVMASAFNGKTDFAYDSTDAENTPNLSVLVSAEGGNTINIVYKKVVDNRGLPCIVTVNNVYETVTKYVDNGEYKEDSQIITGSNKTYGRLYAGQIFTTTDKGISNGFSLDTRKGVTQPAETIKITGDTQVTFYWYQEVDQTVPATVQVIHHYTINDANPNAETLTWTVGDDEDSVLSGYYANQTYIAPYNFLDGQFTMDNVVEVVPSDAANTGIALAAGKNVIHIYYEKNIDSRVPSSVKVIHNYYASEEKLNEGVTEATYEENIDKISENTLMEADTYTAILRETNANLPYIFNSATPENYTVIVDKDITKNVITISYVRAQTTYTVTHNYYANGSLENTQTTTANGNVGDTVTADSIQKLTSYNGRNYNYTSASGDITLVADAANNTITLRYDRTYSTGGGGGGSTKPDQDPDVDIEDPDVPLVENPDGETDIEDPDVPLVENPDGEIDIEEPDIPLVELPEIPEEISIDEEDVPLAQTPDTSSDEVNIDDEDVPLANLPQTGMVAREVDPSITIGMILMTMILLSAGFIYIIPRKSKED